MSHTPEQPTSVLDRNQEIGVWSSVWDSRDHHIGSFLDRGELGVETYDADYVFIDVFADKEQATKVIDDCWDRKLHQSNGGDPCAVVGEKPDLQPEPAAGSFSRNAGQGGAIVPKFQHTTALEFFKAVRPSACILGYKLGRKITSVEQFQALATDADDKQEHLFFHVATVKPTWTSGTTATKDQILECNFLWGDCDADKYVGNDPTEAAKHYSDEGFRISRVIDEGLNRLGITAFAKWRSGAGWQFLIKLDQAISPDEAETLVGKLHIALGFDPIVRNCNRILRVAGSVNWKNGKDGRIPSECLPVYLRDTVSNIDDVRNVLTNVATSTVKANGAATESKSDKIDWNKVKQPGWLKSVDDLPDDASDKLRRIIGHTGTLKDLNYDLIEGGFLHKPYGSWSEVTLAITTLLKFYAKYTSEEIAEALLADLPCNQHITRQKDKERAIERAITRSHSPEAPATDGVRFRDYNRYGPMASLANAVIAIRALGIDACHDLFHHRINVSYKGEAKTIHEGLLTDDTISAVRSLVNNTYRIDCGDPFTLAAIKEVARDNAFDPMLDMLDDFQSKWDGTKRLDTWVIDYLGCEDTPLHRAFGRIVLIAACRRARVPGCKFDNITNLEGPEGKNKSTAIRVLAGDDNFSDQSIIGANDKEVQEQLDGIWMHENADLAGMRKADVDRVNAFASRQIDRARPAYGRVREDRPRRSIEWGTINDDVYLLRQSGNRRWWPLKTTTIAIKALSRDRGQLLGEAATYEAAGESIMLDESLWDAARDAQEQRRVADPWEDVLEDKLLYETAPGGIFHKSDDGYERVASADVLKWVLEIPRAQQTSAHGQRLALAMKRIGWDRPPTGRVTINGVPVRGYVRRSPPMTKTEKAEAKRKAKIKAQRKRKDITDTKLDPEVVGLFGRKVSDLMD
jgi:predicted P-loop ATPase